ncbi:helix-turn-helix domain-containing protein [Candidatus Woesearchaeota archaeon]|nr:helix-turn-helix domain-containing protein [Candidatus Woesearchaeota archaeon]
MRFSLPQEIEVWYIIPAIRKELAKAMRSLGLKQKEIASKLGLRESAVSQYINSKRGKEIKLNKKILKHIKESANKIIQNNSCAIREIQEICKEIKKSKTLCKIHMKYSQKDHCCGVCLCD